MKKVRENIVKATETSAAMSGSLKFTALTVALTIVFSSGLGIAKTYHAEGYAVTAHAENAVLCSPAKFAQN